MASPPSASKGEARVLGWFFAGFFAVAVVLVSVTWVRKSQACASACRAQGHAASDLALSGGGRFAMSVQCACRAGGRS
jgi:hypothetical protein